MADSTGYINLGQVVDSLLNEEGISTRKNRERYLQIATEGLTELSIYHLSIINQAWLSVSSTLGTAKLPSDFIKFEAIGFHIGGEFWSFTEDNSIITPEGTITGQSTLDSDRGENTYVDRNETAALTSKGGINSNYYKIDLKNRRIIINGDVDRSEVLLVYVSSGVNLSDNSTIPLQAVRALKDYIVWRTKKTQAAYMAYALSAKDLRDFETSFTMDQYLDMVWGSIAQGVKR